MVKIDRKNLKQLTYYIGLCRASKYDLMGHVACGHPHILSVPSVTCSHTMTEPMNKPRIVKLRK